MKRWSAGKIASHRADELHVEMISAVTVLLVLLFLSIRLKH